MGSGVNRYYNWALFLYVFSMLLTIAGSGISIMIGYLITMDTNPLGPEDKKTLKFMVMVIPVITAALATFRAKQNYSDKWGASKSAAAQIIAEIYKLRAHVNDYDPIQIAADDPDINIADTSGALAQAASQALSFISSMLHVVPTLRLARRSAAQALRRDVLAHRHVRRDVVRGRQVWRR
jgi:hypothetical protein